MQPTDATSRIGESFARDGYAAPLPALRPDEALRVREQFDALEAEEGRERCQIGLLDRHFDQGFVWEMATHPAILAFISEVLGPDVMLLATHFFCKYPQPHEPGARFVAWHQDVTYWGLEPPMAITAWYAVDDSDVENGCMRAIPGTHAGGIREHGKAVRPGNLLSINQEVPVAPDEEARAVDLVLKAGEISLHHGALIHGSNPNLSRRRRCGLTLRYVPTSVRQVELNSQGRRYTPVLVRGEDRHRHFDARPFPFPLLPGAVVDS
jgi:non-heme Fe2+,alpha-ketoglutarate-dependent halogenase